jgi:aryl-alcohol dehydrogenase-like predicted oxidoreductase
MSNHLELSSAHFPLLRELDSWCASWFTCVVFSPQEATKEYVKLAKKHGLTPVQLALAFVRDRPFTASSIIGATTMDQLKENIDAFTSAPRPLPQEVLDDIETLFKKYKDPAIL